MDFEVKNFESLRFALNEIAEFLRENGIADDSIFDSRLVLCELAVNVLRHSQGRATVTGEIVDRQVEVEVRSSEPFVPPAQSALPDCLAESGRGLYLVDKIGKERFVTAEGGVRVVICTKYRDCK